MTKEELFNYHLAKLKQVLKSHRDDPMSEYVDIDLDDLDSDKAQSLLFNNFYDVVDDDNIDFSSSDYNFWQNELKDFISQNDSEIEQYCEDNNLDYDEIIDEFENFLTEEIEQTDLAYGFYEAVYQLKGTYNYSTSLATLTTSDIFTSESFSFGLVDFDKDFFTLAKITNLDLDVFKDIYCKFKIEELEEKIEKITEFKESELSNFLFELSNFFNSTFTEEQYQYEIDYSSVIKIFKKELPEHFDKMKEQFYPSFQEIQLNKTKIDSYSFADFLTKIDEEEIELFFNISGSASNLLDYSKLNDSYSIPTEESVGIFSGVIYSTQYDDNIDVEYLPLSKEVFSLEKDYDFGSKNNYIGHIASYNEYEFLKTLYHCSYDNKEISKLVKLCPQILSNKLYSAERCKQELDVIIEKNTDLDIIEQYRTIKNAIENNQEKFSIIDKIGEKNINEQLISYLYTPNNMHLQNINATVLSNEDLSILTKSFINHTSQDKIFSLGKNIIKHYNSHTKSGIDCIFETLKDTHYFNELSFEFIKLNSTKKSEHIEQCIEKIILPNFNLNYINEKKENILFASMNNAKLLKILVEKGVNINQVNEQNENILFTCTHDIPTFRLLIEKGANIHQINKNNKNFLEARPYLGAFQEEFEKLYFETHLKEEIVKPKKIKI